MDIFGIGSRSLNLSERTLNMVSKATLATASNISNSETPGYQAVRSDFESTLRQSLVSGSKPDASMGGLKLTNGRHIPSQMEPNPTYQADRGPERWDGNNVDMEREVTRLTELNIKHSLYSNIADLELARLKSAVASGK